MTQVWDSMGFNSLHLATYKNSFEIVKILADYMTDQFKRSSQSIQSSDSVSSSEKLILWIMQAMPGDEGFTCVHYAAFNGNLTILRYFFLKGISLQRLFRRFKVSLFHAAAQGDQPGALAFLKEQLQRETYGRCSDFESMRDHNNSTPLHWACAKDSINCIQFLIAWDFDIDA